MKKRYLLLILILGFVTVFWLLVRNAAAPMTSVGKNANDPSLAPETLPAQKEGLIVVTTPLPQSQVSSPLIIKGKARGNWYFEGSFPVTLVDGQGTVLAQAPATAQGDWMTTEYVPFTLSLSYTAPLSPTQGYVILKKDNPSGEPQFDDQLSIPVTI